MPHAGLRDCAEEAKGRELPPMSQRRRAGISAAGIPARVVRGVAITLRETKGEYVEDLGHAWAEIYLPVYGWQVVDPTYGITRKDEFFCFANRSHIAEEYGVVKAKEFGSLEKGWALQIRRRNRSDPFPIKVKQRIVVKRREALSSQ